LPGLGRFFASVDLRSLALFRIALALVLCIDLLARLRLVDTLFSNDGVLTNHFSLFRPLVTFQFSLYVAASSTRDVTVVFWLTLLVYLLFLVGYRTRLFQVISFILVTSLHSRNLLAELPSDIPLHLFLAWSLVMPLGARFSVDNVRKSMKKVEEHSPDELNARAPIPTAFTSVAVVGIMLQLSVIHLVSALRQDGPTWSDGTALYYALYQNLWATDWGTWLANHASIDTLKRLTVAFRASEIAIAALVLVPLWYVRRVAAVLMLAFHLASRALWNFGPYEWVMLSTVPLLLTTRDWDAFVRWYAKREPALTVYFDADCGICFFLCRLLKRFDATGKLTFSANSSDEAPPEVKALASETVVVCPQSSKSTFTRSRALASLLASIPLGWPLALVLRAPGVSALADFAYDKVAKNRAAISVWFGFEACGIKRQAESAPSPVGDEPIKELERGLEVSREAASLLFLVVCAAALFLRMNDDTKPHGIEGPIYSIVAYPRLYQDWKLFAPDPPKRQGALVVDAQTGKGAKIDPFTGQPPLEALDPKKPDPRARPLAPLMAAYFASINQPNRVVYVDEMKNYLQRLSDQREAGDKLVYFNVNWIEAPIPSPDAVAMPPSATAEVIPPRRITSRP
jgi:predicted DCC family thiol-disulfide oxidoreductase YuxK